MSNGALLYSQIATYGGIERTSQNLGKGILAGIAESIHAAS